MADPRFDLLAFRSGPIPHDLGRQFLGVFSSTRRALGCVVRTCLAPAARFRGMDWIALRMRELSRCFSPHLSAARVLVCGLRILAAPPTWKFNDWFISSLYA